MSLCIYFTIFVAQLDDWKGPTCYNWVFLQYPCQWSLWWRRPCLIHETWLGQDSSMFSWCAAFFLSNSHRSSRVQRKWDSMGEYKGCTSDDTWCAQTESFTNHGTRRCGRCGIIYYKLFTHLALTSYAFQHNPHKQGVPFVHSSSVSIGCTLIAFWKLDRSSKPVQSQDIITQGETKSRQVAELTEKPELDDPQVLPWSSGIFAFKSMPSSRWCYWGPISSIDSLHTGFQVRRCEYGTALRT